MDGRPRLFQTDPAGVSSEWKAQAAGRNGKTLREFLEANYEEDASEEDCCVLACRTLLEVVDSGSGSIELLVVREAAEGATAGKVSMVPEDKVKEYVEAAEKATEEAAGSSGGAARPAAGGSS